MRDFYRSAALIGLGFLLALASAAHGDARRWDEGVSTRRMMAVAG